MVAADPRDHHRDGEGGGVGGPDISKPQFYVIDKEIMFLGFSGDHRVGP